METKKITGIELITLERQEQIEKHGRSVNYDTAINDKGQLIHWVKTLISTQEAIPGFNPPAGWDIQLASKMVGKSYKDRLVIAGALIAAEIDRLQAIENNKTEG